MCPHEICSRRLGDRMDMFSAKGLDDTSGVGPWITTRDEFGDGHPDLELTLTVDGDVRQQDRTRRWSGVRPSWSSMSRRAAGWPLATCCSRAHGGGRSRGRPLPAAGSAGRGDRREAGHAAKHVAANTPRRCTRSENAARETKGLDDTGWLPPAGRSGLGCRDWRWVR